MPGPELEVAHNMPVQAAPAWQAPEPKRINAAPLPLRTLDVEDRRTAAG